METATKMFIRARESVIPTMRGETMTEYSLIFAAVAIVVYSTYRALDNNIGSLAGGIGSTMADSCRRVLRRK